MFECVCYSFLFLYQMRVNPPEEGSVPCAGAFAGPAWPSAPEESVEVWNERIVVNSESSQVLREGHWRHWTSCSVITLKLEMCPADILPHSPTIASKQTCPIPFHSRCERGSLLWHRHYAPPR